LHVSVESRVGFAKPGGIHRVSRILAFCIFLLGSSTGAFAQNINDFVRIFGGIIQQAGQQAALSEWQQLPPVELTCVDQNLRQQGASVAALVNRGVLPSAPQLAQLRSICRSQIARTGTTQPSFNCASARTPDELAICANGELAQFDNAVAAGYQYVRQASGDAFAKLTDVPLLQARRACGADVACVKDRQIAAINTFHNLGAPVGISLWTLNGSTMILLSNGHSRLFFYEVPRPGMASAGAGSGSLLFEGESSNQQYAGTAYMFSAGCAQLPYRVQGPILDDYERVDLQGVAPRVGDNCNVQGYFQIDLEFRLVKPPVPSPSPVAESQSSASVQTSPTPTGPALVASVPAAPATPPIPAPRREADVTPVEPSDAPQRPQCETLVVARPYFVAQCIAHGMEIKHPQEGLADARAAAERERQGLADCAPESLIKLQQIAKVSSTKILNSNAIAPLMDFSDAMKLECNKAANGIFKENASQGN
jgi:uncharacterized protein